jgi:hypothetical protein
MHILKIFALNTVLLAANAYSDEFDPLHKYPHEIGVLYPLGDNFVQLAKGREVTAPAVQSQCMDYRIDSDHDYSSGCVRRYVNVAINEYEAEGCIEPAKSVEHGDQKTTLAQYDEFDATMQMFNELSDQSTEEEAEFYKITRDYLQEGKLANDRWNESFDAVQAPRILDYAVLTSDEEIEYQKGVVRKYIDESIAAKKRSDNWVLNYKKRLSVLGADNDFAKGAIKGASERWAARQKVINPLTEAHIKYGNSLFKVLELLQDNKGDWSYQDNQLQFNNDDIRSKYNALSHSINGNAAIINSLSRVANPGM